MQCFALARRLRAAALALPLLAAAACSDRAPTAAVDPEQPGPGTEVVAALACAADVRAGTVTCRSADPSTPRGVSAVIVGGQGQYVQVVTSGSSYAGGVFRADARVVNLTSQVLGTTDGVTPAAEGVRVFVHSGPAVTGGEGEVTVDSADGTGTFTAGGQPYWQYAGALAPGDTTGAREWRFNVPATVETFEFTVYVSAPVRSEAGWVELTPVLPALAQGGTLPLTATVRTVTGRALPGEPVAWASQNPSVATVSSAGVVTGVAPGTATITATSGARTGSVQVRVGSSSGDAVPPTLHSYSFTPTRVDADGADSVTVTFTLSDAGTGATSASINFVSPTAGQSASCFSHAPAEGTGASGTWRCQLAIREFAEGGVWTVDYVSVADQVGNSDSRFAAQLRAAGAPVTLHVNSPDGDAQAPTFTGFTFAPDTVAANGADSVTVTFTMSDAGTGVDRVTANFVSPSGGQSASCLSSAPVSGTRSSGTFQCRFALASGAAEGAWKVDFISAADRIGNSRSLFTAAVQAAGFPTVLQVVSPGGDSTPPTFDGFTFSPDTVAANGADSVTVTFTVSDAGAGVDRVSVNFTSPTAGQSAGCFTSTLASGTRASGTFQCRVAIAPGAETGAWKVDFISAADQAGNSVSLFTPQVQSAGFPTQLFVTP